MSSINRKLANLITSTGDVASSALDNAASMQVFSSVDSLPTSSLSAGDQALVGTRLYISNGSGWYNVALINATPTLTIDPTGAVALAIDGSTPTVITLTGTDSDNADASLVYSAESDGNFGGLATLSQDSSVFTITPLGADSATTASSTLTFKVSDGINFGSGTTTFTLAFIVADANYTTLLAKADAAGTDNQVDASTNTHTITETGNVTSTAFTPYHPGGYSTSFDGVSDYLSFTMTSAFNLTGDFTLECWFNPNAIALDTQHPNIIKMGTYQLYINSASNFVGISPDGASVTLQSANSSIALNTWYHVAVVRSGSSEAMFLNGTRVDTNTASTVYGASSGTSLIGTYSGTGGDYNGTIRDLRLVNGTAIYDPSETTISTPTEPLTAVANTSLLTCHLPYIADGSSNNHTITSLGNTLTKRFGPYDYIAYTKAAHGGSVYFDGTGDYLTGPTPNAMTIGSGDFTIECWFYATSTATNKGVWDTHSSSGSGDGLVLSRHTDNTFRIYATSQILISGATAINNAWVHLAVVRDGTDLELFVNGISQGTTTWSVNMNSTTATVIGGGRFSGSNINAVIAGYIQDFRIVKSAVYTSAFTPPTAPLTAITNTQLLTCANKNDIWDVGSGNLLTKVGNTTASNAQRKFTGSSAIYLDGTDDYVQASDMGLGGANAFTIEAWVYPTVYNTYANDIYSHGANLSVGADFLAFGLNSAGNVQMFKGSGSPVLISTSAPCASLNQWYHIAFVRESNNNTSAYVNGVLVAGPTTISGALTYAPTGRAFIGTQSYSAGASDRSFEGYIQDFRITKGLARYTSAFTPPTAEFTG